jgi:subtilisin family serine protease
MAPECELVSLKVCRLINGSAVTSSAALIAALEYVRTEVNLTRNAMRIHGVNLSLGCEWDPSHYAAGQSPLCQLINELVDSGVNVVISAGNNGSAKAAPSAKHYVGVAASITEPGHAEKCITVGSTHRDAPHTFGVSWTSSKGPTLDGRNKPDVVAPGEWICSAATGIIRTSAGLDGLAVEPDLTYAEQSGTSMAAPHVSGILAGFLSSRPEFIGRPTEVKAFVIRTAVDLGRDRNAQGAGLIDSMRMLGDS